MTIYKQYMQAELDRQYNTRLQVPEFADYINGWELRSKQAEQQYPAVKNIAYGDLPREQLDIYPSSKPYAKGLVFIHGGYWQRFDKSFFQFVSMAFHSYDVTTVILNFPLAPAATIEQIGASCLKAVQWLQANLSSYNGDADQMYVAGHSAGAHLMTMLMADSGQANGTALGADVFKGACALSGLFNLVPVQLCEVNKVLQMDAATALKNSPTQFKPHIQCPLMLAVGGAETKEFIDQSTELYECWKDNIPINFSQIAGANHFSILDDLCDPTTTLHNNMRQLMEI
ncbi:MAG: alpha/beta hydrolase [Ferruginibacter sp.]